jgi:hypothetical protein
LDSGVTLILNFDAWSSAERKMYVGLSTAVSYHFQGGGEVTLTDALKTLTMEMTPDSSTSAGILQFNCGNSTLPVYIDNVSLVKKSAMPVKKGLRSYKKDHVSFNRVGSRIYWSSPSRNATASLMDLSGRLIQSAVVGNPVRLAKMPSGVYLFVVNSGAKKQVIRVAQ